MHDNEIEANSICGTMGERQKFNMINYFSMLIGGVRTGIVVGASLATIIWTPAHAHVVQSIGFTVPVMAFTSVGSTMGDTFFLTFVTLVTILMCFVEATIAICICANLWVIPPMVFVILSLNLYFTGYPLKTLLSAMAIVLTVALGPDRAATGDIHGALRLLWTMLIAFLISFAIAIAASIAIPSAVTYSLREESQLLLEKTKQTLLRTSELCQSLCTGDRVAIVGRIHILKLHISDCNETIPWLENRARTACRELIVCFPFTSIALEATPRIQMCKRLITFCEEVLEICTTILTKKHIRQDPDTMKFFDWLEESFELMHSMSDQALVIHDPLVPEIASLYEKYLESVQTARVKLRNLIYRNNRTDIAEGLRLIYSIQLQFYQITSCLSKCAPTKPTTKVCIFTAVASFKFPFLASKKDLMSFRRVFNSIKFGVMAGLGQMFTFLFPEVFEYGNANKTMYVALTVALLSTVNLSGSNFVRILSRIIGTGIGVMFTLVIFVIAPTPVINASFYPTFLIAAWCGFCFAQLRRAGRYSYAVIVSGLTPLLVSMDGVAFFPTKDEEIGTLVTRLFGTAVGASFCLIASMIWLYRASASLNDSVATLFLSMARAFQDMTTTSHIGEIQAKMNLVNVLLFECQIEPTFWSIPFQESQFLAMNALLKKNVRLLSLIDGAIEIGGLREESSPWRDSILRMRVVDGPVVQVMHKLAAIFGPGRLEASAISQASWDEILKSFAERFDEFFIIIDEWIKTGTQLLRDAGHILQDSELDERLNDANASDGAQLDENTREYVLKHHKRYTRTMVALNAIYYYLAEYRGNLRQLISAVNGYAVAAGLSREYDKYDPSTRRSIGAQLNLLLSG